LFPALAVAAELRSRHPTAAVSFIGGRRGLENRLVPQAGYPLMRLRMSGLKGRGPVARLGAAMAAGWAVVRCALAMLARRPRLVVGVGGYASGPGVLAARMLGVPTMILEQNDFPGATNRWLAPRVDAVCVPSAVARQRLGRGIVTGNPVRAEFVSVGAAPADTTLSLLVFGGSRGARSINRAMAALVEVLARLDPPPRIVHQTGANDAETVRRAVADYPGTWQVHEFIDDMPARLADADLVVCRAGATTLAELTAAGRPAILVPYPHAADDHQRYNAETLQNAGAALVVGDDEIDGGRLADVLLGLAADRTRLETMGLAARRLARPDAARRIADVADALLAGENPGEGADVP